MADVVVWRVSVVDVVAVIWSSRRCDEEADHRWRRDGCDVDVGGREAADCRR
jgi:hypothetical protein